MIIGSYPLDIPGSPAAFDPEFYTRTYSDLRGLHLDPYGHYQQIGQVEGRYKCNSQLSAHEALLRRIAIFDERFYRSKARLHDKESAAVHYLLNWRTSCEPSASFEGKFLAPYYPEIGLNAPPAIAYAVLKDAGWPVYRSRSEALRVAKLLLNSGLFDAGFYRKRTGRRGDDLAQALHYVIVGERLGLDPSPHFQVSTYARQTPNLVAGGGANLLLDYISVGRAEGRIARLPSQPRDVGRSRTNGNKPCVLVVTHEASRTGAPILAFNIAEQLKSRYGVVVLLLNEGELVENFSALGVEVVGPLRAAEQNEAAYDQLLDALLETYRPRYVLVNSLESRAVLARLTASYAPTVTLVHEFATLIYQADTMLKAMDQSTELVFPARAVLQSATQVHTWLDQRRLHVLPQGQSRIPPRAASPSAPVRDDRERLLAGLGGPGTDGVFTVLGLGSVEMRKGVDLFIACAAAVRRRAPERPVRFVWIGRGYRPRSDMLYSAYLAEQITRSGVEDIVTFIEPVGDLEPAYDRADVLFLSSRLDPLPNVAIDASLRGIPVLSFAGSGGVAEIFHADPQTASSVFPYGDVEAVAKAIVELSDAPERLEALGAESERLARKVFDMGSYVAALDQLGIAAGAQMDQRRRDAETILSDATFDESFFLRRRRGDTTREVAVNRYLVGSNAMGRGDKADLNPEFRKPAPGFNPLIYAELNRERCETANPLAEYIRSGKPKGPWVPPLLRPAGPAPSPPPGRLALHCHLEGVEFVPDLFRRLRANRTRCDLFLTTGSLESARDIGELCRRLARDPVTVRVSRGKGVRFGPLLDVPELARGPYGLVGHLHSKPAANVNDQALGRSWRHFLWQHLVGDFHPMLDWIGSHAADCPGAGLLFPEEPQLTSRPVPDALTRRLMETLKLAGPLPRFTDFPRGGMFWVRPKVLVPFYRLGLGPEDFFGATEAKDPASDALQRLLPDVTRRLRLEIGTIHIPGLRRSPTGG